MARKKKKDLSVSTEAERHKIEKIRKAAEATASFGMILLAAGLVIPLANLVQTQWVMTFRWVYMAGAVIFTVARCVGINDPAESMRLRRLRRLEAWSGFAFCIAAFFWFYNSARYAGMGLTLTMLKETIVFSLVGAVIQLVASWMIYGRLKKETVNPQDRSRK